MQESGKPVRFFSSANTPQGYQTCFEKLYTVDSGWKAYLLWGDPGTTGSSILKIIAESFEKTGERMESIYSPLESSSLNALSFPEKKVCIIDATPPNDFLPEYPGLIESFVNLSDIVDEDQIARQRDRILLFSSRVSSSTDRAFRFLAASASLLNDTFRLVLDCTDIPKLENYASHLAQRLFPSLNRQGKESCRFLTAVTPEGIISLIPDISSVYSNIIEVKDDYGIGKLLLSKLRTEALSAGYDVITCPCPMFPDGKPEHLLIPSLSLAYITSDSFHKYEGSVSRHIHMKRFVDCEAIRLKHPRISFNRKAARELIGEAVVLLADAQASRNMIRNIFDEASDKELIKAKAEYLASKI